MIIAIDEILLPEPVSMDAARELFRSTAPKYKGMRGLVRKHYFVSSDGKKVGGVYVWQSRADAERAYTESWKSAVREKYGADPTITYLECPVTVDNERGEIIVHAQLQ